MRLKLSLQPQQKKSAVPINYQYPLSAAIYNILRHAAPAYADFLHDHGYPAPSGRLMKLFTFSKLWIPHVRREKNILISKKGFWSLQISSPMMDEFVQNFVLGLFESTQLTIAAAGCCSDFQVMQVESLPLPQFKENMRCKCLSPIVASTMREYDGKLRPYYFSPLEQEWSTAIRKNLLEKYQIIHQKEPNDDRLQFRLEANDRPKSKLITVKEGKPQATQIRAYESYFTLNGNPELIQIAWECGLGEHNSQGFGMVEVVEHE